MGYKTVLIYVDDSKRRGAVIDVGLRLAGTFQAHVIALHVQVPAYDYAYYDIYPASGAIIKDAGDTQAVETANRLQSEFQEQARQFFGTGRAEWRCRQGELIDVISRNARHADLVILPQREPDDAVSLGAVDMPALVAMSSGRPVLVVPYAGATESLGEHILVTWNGSREATRAATEALPLLKRAKRVTIMIVDEGKRLASANEDQPSADIALYFARHGVKAEVSHVFKGSSSVSDLVLSAISDKSVDLLCMGAYGHSRMREIALGGVTYSILRQMTVPTLLAC